MLPSFETDMDVKSAIFIIATLSPKARNSLELELYRDTVVSDGATDEYILEDAFVNLMKDIESIGLNINIDYSTYCEDKNTLFSFLRLCTVLLPNSLYDIIRTNTKVRHLVDTILKGNLGDNETTLEIYLSELAGLNEQIPIFPELTDFTDQIAPYITQTDTFTDYLKNMIQLAGEERPMIESDHKTHQNYTLKMKDLIGRFSEAVDVFSNDPRSKDIFKLRDLLVKDFLSPDNFHDYSYLFLHNENTIPEDLIDRFKKKIYLYKVGSPWCFEYYSVRNSIPNADSGIWPTIYCFEYTLHSDEESFKKSIETWDRFYPNRSDLPQITTLYKEV